MSGLREGNRYWLSTESKCNKSVIFVKLTDSAVQSIERLLNSKGECTSKPTIQFQNNSGVISLPTNGRKHNYEFTLSNIEGDGLQSSFQCLQHIDNSSLESLGYMFMKMQIHATEDSYEKTKCKMTAADQEQKNLCTKELRQRISWSGNKITVKRPGLVYIPEKTQSSFVKSETPKPEKTYSSFIKPEPPTSCLKKKVTSPATLIQQPIRERIIHILAAKAYKKAEILLRLKKEGISDKEKGQINALLLEVANLKGNIFLLKNDVWNEVREDWEFCSEEELQLIIKKKQQFMKAKNANGILNLSKSFVKQKDPPSPPETVGISLSKKQKLSDNGAQNYDTIFQTDSCFTNGNTLTYGSSINTTKKLPHFHDSSGYSNDLKKQISSMLNHKKVLPVDKNNHFVSNGTSQQLDIQSTVKSNIAPSSIHQDHRNEEVEVNSVEKMCVEETDNCNEVGQHKSTSTLITSNALSVCKQSENGNVPQFQVKQSNSCSETNINGHSNLEGLSVSDKIKLYRKLQNESSPPSHKKGNKVNGTSSKVLPLTVPAPEFDFSEITLKYTKVESIEQRSQYVQDFKAMYEEYMNLQIQMKETSEKFSGLFDRLKAYPEGSLEFKKMKVEISKEYKKALNTNNYIASRKKFEFFKAKLSHIKEVILDYDKRKCSEEVL